MTVALNRRRGAKQSELGVVRRLLCSLGTVAIVSGLVASLVHHSSPASTYLKQLVASDGEDVVAAAKEYPERSADIQTENTNTLTTQYNERVECSLTVVVLDPRMPYFGKSDTMFTKTLESVAEYVPESSCIVLQTSICKLRRCLENGIDPQSLVYLKADETDDKGDGPDYDPQVEASCNAKPGTRDIPEVTDSEVLKTAARMIRERSGPQLRRLWKKGRVRVSMIGHEEYSFRACDQFYTPNHAFLSASYWIDEFVAQDSDKILMVQRDSFMCKRLELSASTTWNNIDYVGAHWFLDWPWMNINFMNNKTILFRPERKSAAYSVDAWRDYWREIDSVYTGHSTNSPESCDSLSDMVNNIHCALPTMPDNLVGPESLPKRYWVGNGGFSLRSRKWMVRIIRLCPKRKISHLSDELVDDAWCRVVAVNEDIVFSMLLELVGANVASPLQASFFSMDHNFGLPNHFGEAASKIERELGKNTLIEYEQETQEIGHGVPIGQHKCFKELAPGKKGRQQYGCIDSKWCKYSFNTNGRPTTVY